MSILKPTLEKLSKSGNTVICNTQLDTYSHPELSVFAVALITFNGLPRQVLFTRGNPSICEVTGEETAYRAEEETYLIVKPAEDLLRYFGPVPKDKTTEDVFAFLMHSSGHREITQREVYVLHDFSPVKEKVKYHHFRDAEKIFSAMTAFKDPQGFVYKPILGISVNPVIRSLHPGDRPERHQKKFHPLGNLLIWASDGSLHWVSSESDKKILVSVQRIDSFNTYTDLLAFLCDVNGLQAEVEGCFNITPKPTEPKEEIVETDEVLILRALQKMFASNGVFSGEVLAYLDSINKKLFDQSLPGLKSELVGRLTLAINEYFIILDGVGPKKRAEIKAGILEHFEKQI